MTEETMNIHKALCELKILDDRIRRTIDSASFMVAANKSAEQVEGMSKEDYAKNAKAADQKIKDLINRRSAIKRAIVLSNATTEVTVAGKTMTVAEAIDEKNNGINLWKRYLDELTAEYERAHYELEKNSGENLQNKCEAYIRSLFGSSESKVETDDIAALKKDYLDTHEYILIDPIKVTSIINSLQEYCDTFFAEVDSALSTSNALTTITIKY